MNNKQQPQPIQRDVVYPFQALELVGLGMEAVRALRDKGLPCRYLGNRGFVDGGDLADFIMEHGATRRGPAGGV
jgi:hypothetical protein